MNNDESKYELHERIAILMEAGKTEREATVQAYRELAERAGK